MKILILTCHTGGGHDSAAKAVAEELHRRGHSSRIMDALAMVSPAVSRLVSDGHVWMYRHAPQVFDKGYGWAARHPQLLERHSHDRYNRDTTHGRLSRCLAEGRYDAVLCTHVFAAMLLRNAPLPQDRSLRTAFLATDYGCSPGVGELAVDTWFIPAISLTDDFVRGGVPAERITVSGIPIRPGFCTGGERETAKLCQGIHPDSRHAVMMCGSMGCGPMEAVTGTMIECMEPDMELTVVCGSNDKLREHLEEMFRQEPRVHIRGFVKNMDLLMDSADICLTKPGGISTTECAAKGVPMVLIDAVAGCETHNLCFFLKLGGAVTADCPEKLAVLACELLANEKQREIMSRTLKSAKLDRGARTVVDVLAGSDLTEKCI